MHGPSYRFDHFEYVPAACRLLRQGEPLPVQPKVLLALELFLEQPGDVVDRSTLMQTLWPGVFVTDNSLEQVIRKLRHALDDRVRPHRTLETVSGRGYRFAADVQLTEAGAEAERPRTNLPSPDPSFVGRTTEHAALTSLCEQARLITVLGPGGCGKTALTRDFASSRAWSGACPTGGVWFCDLSSATDTRSVLDAIATGLGGAARTLTALADGLSMQASLVVLDNVEQVVPAVAEVAEALLAASPEVRLLLTSRVRLDLASERCLDLDALSVDEAVALLRDRAEATRVGLGASLDEEVATSIVEVLQRMPLAIRLAAARLPMMSPQVLLERLSDQVGWLGGHSRDLPPRQSSLLASVRWSWDLLSEPERIAASQCAVFRGGFTLDAAEAVIEVEGGDVMDLLMGLRDASLLRPAGGAHEPRFDLLQPVREFALEALDPSDGARERHAAWAASLFEPLRAGKLEGRRRGIAERENLWAAAGHTHDPEHLVGCVRTLFAVDLDTPDRQALAALNDRAVRAAEASVPQMLFGVLNERVQLQGIHLHQFDRARQDLVQLQQLAEHQPAHDVDLRVEVHMTAGLVELEAGDLPGALAHFRTALERAEGPGRYSLAGSRQQAIAHARLRIGAVLGQLGEQAASTEAFEGALDAILQVDKPWLHAMVLHQLGRAYLDQGRLAEQQAADLRALEIHQRIGDTLNAGRAHLALARNARARGDLAEADLQVNEALVRASHAGVRAQCLMERGTILAIERAHAEAAACLSEAEALHLDCSERGEAALAGVLRAAVLALAGDLGAALVEGRHAVSVLRSLEPPSSQLAEAELLVCVLFSVAGEPDQARPWLEPHLGRPDPLVRAAQAHLEARDDDLRIAIDAIDGRVWRTAELRWFIRTLLDG